MLSPFFLWFEIKKTFHSEDSQCSHRQYLCCQSLLKAAGCVPLSSPFLRTAARTGSQNRKVKKYSSMCALFLSLSLRKTAVASIGSTHFFPLAKTLDTLGSSFGTASWLGYSLWHKTYERNHLGSPIPGRTLREIPYAASHMWASDLLLAHHGRG